MGMVEGLLVAYCAVAVPWFIIGVGTALAIPTCVMLAGKGLDRDRWHARLLVAATLAPMFWVYPASKYLLKMLPGVYRYYRRTRSK